MNVIAGLPADWQAWVRLNASRGCSAESMVPLLIGGGFAADIAAAAVAETMPGADQTAAPLAPGLRPAPRIIQNYVDCGGHVVRVAAQFERPQIVVFDDVLSASECAGLMALADQRMAPSTVIDDADGEAAPHIHRTSAGAFFQNAEFPEIAALELRIAQLLQWPVANGEGLQILRYEVGGEYRAHFDYFDPAKPGSARHLAQAGQRVGTLLIYLCDVPAGGGTRFPSIGLEVRPRRGAGVYFADVDAAGAIDPATLHAGVPVVDGVKYIATRWLRQQAFAAPRA